MRLKLNKLHSLINEAILIAEAIRKAYDILGVNSSVTPEELKKAYRAKASLLHPDKNHGVDTSEDMQNLNYAYSLLSDQTKKTNYDLNGDRTLGDLGQQEAPSRKSSDAVVRDIYKPRYFWNVIVEDGVTIRCLQMVYCEAKSNKIIFDSIDVGDDGKAVVRMPISVNKGFIKCESTLDLYKEFKNLLKKLSNEGWIEEPQNAQDWAEAVESERVQRENKVKQPSVKTSNPNPPNPATPKTPASVGGGKETYKIYGRNGKFPVHTRIKGKVYGGAPDSKFKVNDRANINVNGDKLKVTNPETGHSQDWQAESVKNMSNGELINEIFEFLTNN